MSPFAAGFLLGAVFTAAFAGCLLVVLRKPRRREISQWTDEHYQAPPVVTRVTINRHRSFDI
jgi:hypothetical protein